MKVKKTNKKGSTLIVETSTATKKKISAVAVKIREKKLFQEKVEAARASLAGLTSLPL